MRGVLIESFGTPVSQHIKLTTMPTPTLDEPTDVLIRVLSAAINPIDKMIAQGDTKTLIPVELPAKLGFDVSGVVERVGPGVTKFKPGDEVSTPSSGATHSHLHVAATLICNCLTCMPPLVRTVCISVY